MYQHNCELHIQNLFSNDETTMIHFHNHSAQKNDKMQHGLLCITVINLSYVHGAYYKGSTEHVM